MRLPRPRAAWLLLIIIGAALPARALDPRQLPSQYLRRQWTVADGLPQSSVYAIAQDAGGYIWLGTEGGLVRFDGISFRTYDIVNTPALATNHVRFVYPDAAGTLWVATHAAGLMTVRDKAFHRHGVASGLSDAEPTAIGERRDGSFVVGTERGELFAWQQDQFVAVIDEPLATQINAVREDPAGTLWLGTYGAGLFRLDSTVPVPVTLPDHLSGFIRSLLLDADGRLWVGDRNGVALLAGGRPLEPHPELTASGGPVFAMAEDRNGALWFAIYGLGVIRLADGRVTQFTPKNGLPGKRPWSLFEDREENLWIGIGGAGLVELSANTFTVFGRPEGLSHDDMGVVASDHEGRLWVGTEGGLDRLENGRILNVQSAAGSFAALSLAIGADGRVWVGMDRGVAEVQGDQLRSVPVANDDPVLGLHVEPSGRLLVGTAGHGAWWYHDGASGRALAEVAELETATVRWINRGSDGSLWLGTSLGLTRARGDEVVTFTEEDGLPAGDIGWVYEDPEGALWLGANGGLGLYRDGEFYAFTASDGIACETVWAILEDQAGHLWLSGNKGIFRVAKKQLLAAAAGNVKQIEGRLFGTADGLRNREANGGTQPAAWRDAGGRLWFATIDGLASIHPEAIGHDDRPPRVHIDRFSVDGRLVARFDAIILPAATRKIQIDYTGLSFTAPAEVRFKYRLEGFDPDWVDAGTERAAHYTNLPPGAYRFEVIAANRDGVWSDTGASLTFHQDAFFHQTPAFWLICIAFGGLAIFGLYRLRILTLHRRQAELEALVRLRTREIEQAQTDLVRAERMASVATLVRGIAHELNNPIGFIAGNVRHLQRYCRFLLHAARELSELVPADAGEPLTTLAPGKDLAYVATDLEAILEDFGEGARRAGLIIGDLQSLTSSTERGLERVDLARAARQTVKLLGPQLVGIDVSVDVESAPIITARAGHLEQVLVNLIDNAAQATGAGGAIRVSIVEQGGEVIIEVRDDGPGMEPETRARALQPFFTTKAAGQGSGLGLAIVASIVQQQAGEIVLDSSPGRGTSVRIKLPLAAQQGGS